MYLRLENINKNYKDEIIFKNLNCDFCQCGFYLVMGNSGSGKSTLLNILAGYESFEKGKRCVSDNLSIACIFQNYELIEELTVDDNIRMSFEIYEKRNREYLEVIEELGLTNLLSQYPHELSTGQKQRVGIARALLCRAQIILCDEPTESLDIENKKRVLAILKRMSKKSIVIVATHDEELTNIYCDCVLRIENNCLKTFDDNLQDIKETNIEIKYNPQRTIKVKKVNQFIHKITYKRSLYMNTIFLFLLTLQIGLYHIELNLFHKALGTQALNSNIIYINSYDHQYQNMADPFPSFDPILINNKYYKVNIYPQPIFQDKYIVPQLKDNEIIINQNTQNILKEKGYQEIIGSTLNLSYIIEENSFPLEFKIVDIFNEKDVGTTPQIYYSYEYIVKTLQNKIFSLKYKTQYDYLMKEGNNYSLFYPQNEIQKKYKELQAKKGLSVYHSILTNFINQQKEQTLYLLIFRTIEVTTFILSIISLIYLLIKDVNISQYSFSVLYSLGVSLDKIKQLYFAQKIKLIIPFSLVPFIEIALYFIIVRDMNILNYLICIGYIILNVCLYAVALIFKLKSFAIQNISFILKSNNN